MSIKKFFDSEKQETNQVVRPSAIKEMETELESLDYARAYVKEKERFIPHIDFTKLKNFVKFGSAKQYYHDSISRIYNTYPYDGSLYEKIDWHSGSSFLDLHIFNSEYPKTNGYITMCSSSWGGLSGSNIVDGYGLPQNLEYIYVKSGPNVDNILAASASREENLRLDMSGSTSATGSGGATVEFWLNKSSWANDDDSGLTSREVLFDLWNNVSSGSAGYGRFTLELTGGSDAAPSALLLTVQSGTRGMFRQALSTTVTSASVKSGWNHYAVAVVNTGSSLLTELYVNGKHSGSVTTGTSIGHITGSGLASVGSLVTTPSGNAYDNMVAPDGNTARHGNAAGTHVTRGRGFGKLSGSLDEFRYWKVRRTGKEIGKYWFTQVGGGTNSDLANTDLGVYYKFNEGITLTASTDSTVLDYSGRVSNGSWQGYSYGARNTGSAMVSASVAEREFEDPILYSAHPTVKSFYDEKLAIGEEYDDSNNASLYYTMPGWITEEDETDGGNNLLKLTQMMASYLDYLHLQIEALPKISWQSYYNNSGSLRKPWPFTKELLESKGFTSPDIFSDATLLEMLSSRDELREFEDKIYNAKNLIYNNIYNNLSYINKSKGTEKSFRNLLRCFGVSDELVKLNMYAHNTTYSLEDNYRGVTARKKYIDFNNADRHESTVYQHAHPGVAGSTSYISASSDQDTLLEAGFGFTAEAEVIFPFKLPENNVNFHEYWHYTSSLFGMHTVDPARASTDYGWNDPDVGNFQVHAVRPEYHSKDCYFQLTGTTGCVLPKLTSSLYTDVYDNEKWNFSVGLRPVGYPFTHTVSGAAKQYIVEFYGVNSNYGTVYNEFMATGTITQASADAFLSSSKRAFIGAHKTNFTGTMPTNPTLKATDVKMSSFRIWHDFLSASVIKQHSHDITNRGTPHPYRSAYVFEGQMKEFVPQAHTLALDWDFETVTGSNSSGQFRVIDRSSGSTETRYGWLSDVVDRHHTGRGDFFPTSETQAVQKEYIYAAKKRLPEIVNSIDMVEIKNQDDQVFTKETRPITYFFSIEKSMYQNISDEMINIFSTIKDFNNLIGDYKHQFRGQYKEMEKLRALFFERVESSPDIEKYIKYYKWIDSAVGNMLTSLIPASAEATDRMRVMIESHVLERNKYLGKFPTLEMKLGDPESALKGINEMLYNWKSGHAPTGSGDVSSSCLWWDDRAERATAGINSPGSSEHLTARDKINIIVTTETSGTANKLFTTDSVQYEGGAYVRRRLSRPYKYSVDRQKNFGGVELFDNKKFDYFRSRIGFSENKKFIRFHKDDIDLVQNCREDLELEKNQNEKLFVETQAWAPYEYGRSLSNDYLTAEGDLTLPFVIVSSSATGGYKNEFSNYVPHLDFANVHHDLYGEQKDKPLQGPFTEKYVGGSQHRHIPLNVSGTGPSGAYNGDGYDTVMTRPEGWWLRIPTSSSLKFTELLNEPFQAAGTGWATEDGHNTLNEASTTATSPAGWSITSSYTYTSGTGPSGSYDGDGYYVYAETSHPNNTGGRKFSLMTPLLDAVEITSHFSATFKYHMYGQGIGTMYAQAALDPSFTMKVRTLTGDWNGTSASFVAGQQHSSSEDPWHSASLNLREYLHSKCFVRIVYEGTSDQRGDAAVDEIMIYGSASEGFRLYDVSYNDANKPRAPFYREEYAKRPVNIRNIKQTASFASGTTKIGNYSHTYEVVQTVGRDENNLWFHDFADEKGVNWLSASASPYISGVVDFNLPTRSVNESVIVDRFSSPGGPEVMSRGYLDGESETYSVYNAMPYRNRAVRDSLNKLWSRYSGQFGIISTHSGTHGSQLSTASYERYGDTDRPITASYHKVNRNSTPRFILSGSWDPNKPPPTSLTGGFGNSSSLQLEGATNDYIYLKNSSMMHAFEFGDNTNDSPFSFSAWVKMDDATTFPIFTKMQTPSYNYYNYSFGCFKNDKLSIKCWDGKSDSNWILCETTGTMTAFEDTWKHFVVTYDGSGEETGFNLYIDGTKLSDTQVNRQTGGTYVAMENNQGGGTGSTGANPRIGESSNSGTSIPYSADGNIDEVSIWNTELTADDVSLLWQAADITVGPGYRGETYTVSGDSGPGDLSQHPKYPTYLITWLRMGDHGDDPADGAVGTRYIYDASSGSLMDFTMKSAADIVAVAAERSDVDASFFVEYAVPDTATKTVNPYGLGRHRDNNFVTHQIPRSVRQYSWITASLYSHGVLASAPFEFEKPTASHAGGASSDITFLSASDFGTYRVAGNIVFGTSRTHPDFADDDDTFLPVNFAGINGIIRDPLTASTNQLGYPLGVPAASTVANSEQYVALTSYAGDGFVDSHLEAHPYPDGPAFNSLMLHRNGPYGYPSWKQVRVGQHPIIRAQKTSSLWSISFENISDQINSVFGQERRSDTRWFTEVGVTSRFKPIVHVLDVGRAGPGGSTSDDIKVISSFGNNLTTFANNDINKLLFYYKTDRGGPSPNSAQSKHLPGIKVEPQTYNHLINMYMDPAYANDTPIKRFKYLIYKENIYPRQHNTYRGPVRSRINHLENPVTFGGGIEVSRSFDRINTDINSFWRDTLANRTRTASSASNSQGVIQLTGTLVEDTEDVSAAGTPADSQGRASLSMWPLDGVNQTTGAYSSAGRFYYTDTSGTAGELWNGPTFRADIQPAGLGNQLWILSSSACYVQAPWTHGNHGAPIWKTNVLAKKNPWHDTYEEFSEDTRLLGQDYSIVPEFNISEHLEYYINKKDGNFLAPNNKMFSIKGAQVTASATTEDGELDPLFYSTYLHADFMKHFEMMAEDHKGFEEISRVTLKCKAVKKLLPYNGFYPINRTLQLASLLSRSYGPIVRGYQTSSGDSTAISWRQYSDLSRTDVHGEYYNQQAGMQTLLQSSYAPGIMYNSIKAGVACDWPTITGTYSTAINGMTQAGYSFLSGSPNYRIGFENILDMSQMAASSSQHARGKINFVSDNIITASLHAKNWSNASPLYSLATHNFLAETVNMFLQDGKLNSIVSAPRNQWKAFVPGTTYYMDVLLYKTDGMVMTEGTITGAANHPGHLDAGYSTKLFGPQRGAPYGPAVRYSDASFFDSHVNTGSHNNNSIHQQIKSGSGGTEYGYGYNGTMTSGSAGMEGLEKLDPAFAPYTPPYFYGTGRARLSYLADKSNPTIEDILENCVFSASYGNSNALLPLNGGLTEGSGTEGAYSYNLIHSTAPAIAHRMNVSSSLNLFGKVIDKDVLYDSSGNPQQVQGHVNPGDHVRWSISPKMEFPILNFSKSVNDEEPHHADAIFDTGTMRGMWLGYGSNPVSQEGIYMALSEFEPSLQFRFNPAERTSIKVVENLTGSLIDQCGFGIAGAAGSVAPRKKLGTVAADFQKSISEAVVCVPFTRQEIPGVTTHYSFGGRHFFKIDIDLWKAQKQNVNEGSEYAVKVGQHGATMNIEETSISHMIKMMQKYILPPRLDFIKYGNMATADEALGAPLIPPFVMYMFEFEHKFTRQELTDIWQNIMPEIAMNAEKEEVTISHPTGKFEFFHGKRPFSTVYADEDPKVEWIVFKVKQKAKTNYYSMTQDLQDDDRFKFNFKWGESAPQYSYNWPYDYCSLVELAKIEASVKVGAEQVIVSKNAQGKGVQEGFIDKGKEV